MAHAVETTEVERRKKSEKRAGQRERFCLLVRVYFGSWGGGRPIVKQGVSVLCAIDTCYVVSGSLTASPEACAYMQISVRPVCFASVVKKNSFQLNGLMGFCLILLFRFFSAFHRLCCDVFMSTL